ncbi:MAG: HAMP domain-containing histidine kinase [Methanosarcinales archaeon]|nr:HAMP domain-containing histidine kinase [Methanosarcinales archaeon]
MITKKILLTEDEARHEFLSPVQSIIANAENLFNEAEAGSELKDLAENILQQATKLQFIAENIKELVLESHNVDIYPIIQDTIKLFRKEAKKKGIALYDPVMEEATLVSVIEMSEFHIKQVFLNLIDNAIKYSCMSVEPLERCITVVCNSDGNFYCVEISNYGVGIEPGERSDGLIFKAGYRGTLARDCGIIGLGLGLNTVKRILDMYGGHIEVESKLLRGDPMTDLYKNTFGVYIPLGQPRKSAHGNKKDTVDRR